MIEQIQKMTEKQIDDFIITVDPGTRYMKYYGVPKGVTLVVSVQGSRDILEVINPIDGRAPFFRLREELRVSEDIELSTDEENYDEQSEEF